MKAINRLQPLTNNVSRFFFIVFLGFYSAVGFAQLNNCALINTLSNDAVATLVKSEDPINILSDKSSTTHIINAVCSSYLNDDKKFFADGFMSKAVLIDAFGNIITGKNNIQMWRNGLQNFTIEGAKHEILQKHTSKLSADLMNMAVRVKISIPMPNARNLSTEVTLNSLCRRIDGKWYYETCTIIPTTESVSGVAIAR